MLKGKYILAAVAGLMIGGGAAMAKDLDLTTAEGALEAARKVQCSLTDGKPQTYWWEGKLFSRVRGEPDRLLFTVEGVNVRTCVTVKDPERGTGWRLLSRELLFYKDPKTGEILKTWANPWTGEEVEVFQVANDPVNQRPQFAVGPDGQPLKFNGTVSGNQFWTLVDVPLFYTNPLGGQYQKQIGGTYHAAELFGFYGDANALKKAGKDVHDIFVSWTRISGWLPWMNMGDRSGEIYIHAAGRKLPNWDALPDKVKTEITTNYPTYSKAPPLDDTRPNETSWTYYKKRMEERQAKD